MTPITQASTHVATFNSGMSILALALALALVFMAERWRSAARDQSRTTPTDFIASPLHCLVRDALGFP